MIKERVFVLDYDLISPLGVGKKDVWENIEDQKSAEDEITNFDVDGLQIRHGCEVKNGLRQLYCNEPEQLLAAMRFDRKLELLCAVYKLMNDRLLVYLEKVESGRAGVILGLGVDVFPFEFLDKDILMRLGSEMDPLLLISEQMKTWSGPLNLVLNPFDMYPIYLAEKLGLAAFQKTVLTACAASTQAFILGCQAIARREVDVVLVGGTDSILNLVGLTGFSKLGVLAESDSNPGTSCKPFDVNRKGTLAGEAAGLCLLVSEKYLDRTGGNPSFEVLGHGNTLDAYQITAPDPEAKGMIRAIENALKGSGIKPEEIDTINLHGTGTYLNDPAELLALETVFGNVLNKIPVCSTKDRHGHAIAAAGIQELVVLFECMSNNMVPSTINLTHPIGDSGADFVMGTNRRTPLNIGMSNNFSFGGINTSVVVKKINQ